jgi:site-specific DNA-cytosine methylase
LSSLDAVSSARILHNIYGGFKEKKPRVFEKTCPTIRTAKGGGHLPSVLKDSKIRRLTPIECERLQGFPDDWTKALSDTQRYKTLGNAVTVNVVAAVMERVLW